jgi:FkbM family methyltransferase
MALLSDPKRTLLRQSVLLADDLRHWPILRHRPFSWGVRWGSNRLVPWASRVAFTDGIQHVNGVQMEIPRPPDWGGGGEFHMALGTYEHTELRYVLNRLRPGDRFLDIGAHIGYFSLPVAKRVGPRGQVFAVEPWPPSAALLRRNAALNGFDHVTVLEAAASDGDGEAVLTVNGLSAMWSSLRPTTLDGDTTSITVQTRTLDSLMAQHGWPTIAGMKLDVEGAESVVLRGCEQLFARNPQAFLMIEIVGQDRTAASLESLRILEQYGFRFLRLDTRGHTRPVTVADLLPRFRSTAWQESMINLVAERA